jgi:hypothetical protein
MYKAFLSLTFVLVCVTAYSQQIKSITDIDTVSEIKRRYTSIIYDFNSPQPDRIYQHTWNKRKLISKPWFGKRAMLTIKVNPYLYDVFVSSRQVVDGGMNDAAALRSFTTALDTLETNRGIEEIKHGINKSPLPAQTSDIKTALVNSGTSTEIANKVEEITKPLNITTIREAEEKLSTAALKPFSSEIKHAQDCYEQYKRYGPEYDQKRKIFHTILDTFLRKAKIQQELLNDCDQFIATMLMDKANDSGITRLLDDYCHHKSMGEVRSMATAINSKMKTYQNEMSEAFDEMENVYSEMSDVSAHLCSENSTYKKSDSISFEKAKKIRDQLGSSAAIEIARGVSMMINNLLSKNSFSHPYHSVLIEKDTLAFTIVTRPSTRYASLINRYGIKLYNIDSFEYKIPVKGVFKLNFSIGMAFLYNSLRPTTYYLTPAIENASGDSAEVSIKEGRKTNRFRPTIAALAHAYFKLGGDITPALTIGLSTNPTDFSDASYFLGLSAIMGHQNRFIFTVGLSGSKVEYLNSKYDLNKQYYKIDFVNVDESALSEKTFRSGMFFAVSYNISANR